MVVLQFCKRKSGRCVVIKDNLSSHFSLKLIKLCIKKNSSFCFLPPYSTQLYQSLDVSFFRPMKAMWRIILADYKPIKGKKSQTIQTNMFPKLLKKLMGNLEPNRMTNLQAGLKKGLFPLDPEPVLSRPWKK